MKDGNHRDALWFHEEVDGIRKAAQDRPAHSRFHLGEAEWRPLDVRERGSDEPCEFETEADTPGFVPVNGVVELGGGLGLDNER